MKIFSSKISKVLLIFLLISQSFLFLSTINANDIATNNEKKIKNDQWDNFLDRINSSILTDLGDNLFYYWFSLQISKKIYKSINISWIKKDSTISFEAENLWLGSAGQIVTDSTASNNKAVEAKVETSPAGTIIFGPYTTNLIDWKEYVATFRIKVPANTNSSNIGLIDIFNEDTNYRAYKEFKATDFSGINTYQDFEVPFTKSGSNIQYRAFFYDVADFKVDKVIIREKKQIISPNEPNSWILSWTWNFFVVSIYLDGSWVGKNGATTIEEMDIMRSQLATINPNIKVSWALSSLFVFQESNRPQLAHVLQMVDTYGDEISIGVWFPNNQYNIDTWIPFAKEWIYMYRYNALNSLHVQWTVDKPKEVFNSIPSKYRPTSVTTYAINHKQAEWVRTNFGINAFMWWTANTYYVDQLSWEGSPFMPYWSHVNNPMIPAQNDATNSHSVFLNTITVDPIGSRYSSGESRWTIHPADPETNWVTQLHTINQYLNNPYHDKNTINYISLFVDINWILRTPSMKQSWDNIIQWWPKNKIVNIVWIKQFANIFTATAWNNNNSNEFSLLFRWSWWQKWIYTSPSDTQYLWSETKTERIVLKKQDHEASWSIIDFTDYTKPIPTLRYTTLGRDDDLSYITGRNYKITPTAPITQDQKNRAKERLQKLKFSESVNYEN